MFSRCHFWGIRSACCLGESKMVLNAFISYGISWGVVSLHWRAGSQILPRPTFCLWNF